MADDEIKIITMGDMSVVFSVTDAFGIHRESVSVELAREDPGNVDVTNRGTIEITLPASTRRRRLHRRNTHATGIAWLHTRPQSRSPRGRG